MERPVPLLTHYDTPAGLRDVPDGSRFYEAWHQMVNSIVSGSPNRQWFDPLGHEADFVASRSLSWMGFPRQSLTVTHRDDRQAAFQEAEGQPETREFQPEYFEWHTTRNPTDNKVTKVVFVTETPEYWKELAINEPDELLKLYQEIVHPDVQKSDLFDEGGGYITTNR